MNRKNDSKERVCTDTGQGNKEGPSLGREVAFSQRCETSSGGWLVSQRGTSRCGANKPQRNGMVTRDLLYQGKVMFKKKKTLLYLSVGTQLTEMGTIFSLMKLKVFVCLLGCFGSTRRVPMPGVESEPQLHQYQVI